MCKLYWTDCLDQTLISLRKSDLRPKIAILGIGQELRGDDAAGVATARALRSLPSLQNHETQQSSAVLIIDAGPAVENFTGTLRRFAPDLVILVDAASMDASPGTIRWLDWHTAGGLSAATHSLPLSVFGNYLVEELGCQVVLIGIQPSTTTLDTPLSPAVQRAVEEVILTLSQKVLM